MSKPDPIDDRMAQLREELDRLDLAKEQARSDALQAVRDAGNRHRNAGRTLDVAVAEARGYGATWQQIADAVGLTKPAAWERWAAKG
jgi:hypothetical protein